MVMRVLAIFAIGALAALVSPVLFADEYPQYSIDPDRAQNEVPIGHLDKAYPRNPDELFRCVDASGEQVLSEGPVCARQIRTIYCVRAPCPQSEKWVSYPNAKEACAARDVVEYARDRCRFQVTYPDR